MAEKHEFEFCLRLNMTNLTSLTHELKLEQVKLLSIFLRCGFISILNSGLVGNMKKDFFLALKCFILLFFKVNLLVKNLVCEANNTPPKDVICNFIELFGELVEYS